jgi:hypothetical protein
VSGRLASSVLVSALLRRAQDEGGFGAVLARGDATAGAIAVILAERGIRASLLERLLQPDGSYAWQASARPLESDAEFQAVLDRRRKYDPDLWILELDVASAERFAAEMNEAG